VSDSNINDLSNPAHPLVAEAPGQCARCRAALCLRKQVMNLALGNTDEMYCLDCLSQENGQPPDVVLNKLLDYIQGRDCFAKEWVRYTGVDYCPDRAGCLPDVCFPTKTLDSAHD
jgi:hypothetical protein